MQVSKVLVVDGNRTARDTLVTCLQFIGVDARGAECALTARSLLAGADVIVLTEEIVGLEFAELVEQRESAETTGRAAILMLTRSTTPVIPSNYTVDALLQRPVAVSRVVERIESMIGQRRLTGGLRLTFGALCLDLARARVEFGERHRRVGPTEMRLLAHFMRIPEKVFSRAQLLQRLWPTNVRVSERTVDVHIRRLRSVLEDLGCASYIQTVRGTGYRFSGQLDPS